MGSADLTAKIYFGPFSQRDEQATAAVAPVQSRLRPAHGLQWLALKPEAIDNFLLHLDLLFRLENLWFEKHPAR